MARPKRTPQQQQTSPLDDDAATQPAAYTRLNININNESAEALRTHAKRHRITITEAIRRAIAVWDFVERELTEGNKIQVVDKSGHVREVVLM